MKDGKRYGTSELYNALLSTTATLLFVYIFRPALLPPTAGPCGICCDSGLIVNIRMTMRLTVDFRGASLNLMVPRLPAVFLYRLEICFLASAEGEPPLFPDTSLLKIGLFPSDGLNI